MQVRLMLHPYTARKDLGAGHDRYAFELLTRLPCYGVECSTFESGALTTMPQALFAEAKAVLRLLATPNDRLFHATATANAMAPIAARKRPLLTTIHDVLWFFVKDRYDSRLKYLLKTRAIRRAAKHSDGIIVPFQSTLDFLVDELKVPRERLFLVPYGVDHDQFYPPRDGETVSRPPCFGEREGPTVLFVGAVNYGKGIDTLLKCFAEVVAHVPDAKLLVGSKGWDLPLVKQLWEQSPVRNAIRFIGFVPEDDLRAAYIHADVTCFPSRYGFGLPTLESMACGTPTVSGRVLDAPEFIADAGLLADPDRPEELAAQIIRALTDTALRNELRAKGLTKAGIYRWEETARQTAEVYRRLSHRGA